MTEAETITAELCAASPDEMERLRGLMDFHERRADKFAGNLRDAEEALASLRRMYAAACDRIAGQSELLARAAERERGGA